MGVVPSEGGVNGICREIGKSERAGHGCMSGRQAGTWRESVVEATQPWRQT